MKLKNILVIALIVVLTLLPTVLLIACNNTVSAEELSSESLLNFNQLVLNDYINYSITDGFYTRWITNDNLNISNQIFYITCKSNNNLALVYNNLNNDYLGLANLQSEMPFYGNLSVNKFGVYFNEVGSYSDLNIINLTQMYGSGNEPTLEECEKIFISTYNYNSGVVLPFSYIQAYNNGVTDVYNSLSYSIVASDSYNNLKAYSLNGDSVLSNKYIQEYNGETIYYVQVKNACLFEFNYPLSAGDVINFTGYAVDYGNISPLYVYALTNNGLVKIKEFTFVKDSDYFSNVINLSFNYICASNVTGLVFQNQDTTNNYVNLGNLEVNLQVQNISTLTAQAFNSGVASVDTQSYYVSGYNAGKSAGINESNEYSFSSLISAVIDTPINSIKNMLDFNILGVNMKSLYLSLFTLCLIIAVVKLIM